LTQNGEPYDPAVAEKILQEIKPSALDYAYLEYINTSNLFFKENAKFFHLGFAYTPVRF
jgi:hypothetical protein